jgi:uncharacterized RDD family membrane protein YckC
VPESATLEEGIYRVSGSYPLVSPPLWRRLAAIPYEGLLLLALMLVAAFPVAGLKGLTLNGFPHLIFQLYLFSVSAAYFIWFWYHGGQTLPMKTWHFKVVDMRGRPLRAGRALLRFFCSLIIFGPAVVGLVLLFFPDRMRASLVLWAFLPMIAAIWWGRFDPEHQYLHDRLAGTRLVETRSA